MIRSATLADVNHLLKLEQHCFNGDYLSKRSFHYLLTKANACTLIDEEQTVIRGYAMILLNKRTLIARLYSFAVTPQFRQQGIASRLLIAIEQTAIAEHRVIMRLEVRRDNMPAQKLYEKQGYQQFGIIPNYYDDQMTALRFEKNLMPLIAK